MKGSQHPGALQLLSQAQQAVLIIASGVQGSTELTDDDTWAGGQRSTREVGGPPWSLIHLPGGC